MVGRSPAGRRSTVADISLTEMTNRLADELEIRNLVDRLAKRDDGETLIMTDHLVELDGDTATCESYGLVVGAAATEPELLRFFRFEDTFRRTPQGWKLALRNSIPG